MSKDNGDGFWKKRYDSLMEGLLALEGRLAKCVELNTTLVLEKKQWEMDKMQQSLIIQQALATANANNNSVLEENRALKEEIKRLKGE